MSELDQGQIARQSEPLMLRIMLRAFRRLRAGRLSVLTPGGQRYEFRGRLAGPHAFLHIVDVAGLRRTLIRGDVGFAEAYMAGHWETSDLAALLELGALNERALGKVLLEKRWFAALQYLNHRLRRSNTKRGSRKNIAAHYDLGNDFYALWLDESMTYSSAYFEHANQSLAEAQEAKYRKLIESLAIEPSHHVLEIGCGWGAFACELVTHTGCRVTAITLSAAQHEATLKRVRRLELGDRVDVQLVDYRDVRGQYDRIASIEMFEAVGEAHWPRFSAAVHACLKPGGLAGLQVITIDDAFFESYRRASDFIQRYIFPGGMLPSPRVFFDLAKEAQLQPLDSSYFGRHYAQTLSHWHERFLQVLPDVNAFGFDERFVRMWRYYLAYCEAGFRTGRVDVMQTVLRRST